MILRLPLASSPLPAPPISTKDFLVMELQETPQKKHYDPPVNPKPEPEPEEKIAAPTLSSYLWKRRSQLQMRVAGNLLYQQARANILQGRNRAALLIALIASSTVFAQLSLTAEIMPVIAAVACFSSAALIAFDFAGRANDGAARAEKWAVLSADLEKDGERGLNEERLNALYAQAIMIESGEPPPNRALLEQCFSRAAAMLGHELKQPSKRNIIPFWLRPVS